MNLTKSLKKTKIKKECIKQKFNWIINTSTLVLFFHYTGSKKCNWEIVKKEIAKNNLNCKGLVVPSNLTSLLGVRHVSKNQGASSFLGSLRPEGTGLLIGCESLEQVCALVEKCKAPTFYCVGGLYGQENMLTHLDIKRCVSLEKSLQLFHDGMTKKARMCAILLCLLGLSAKNVFLVLQRSLHFHPAPVHLTLYNALSFLSKSR